MASNLSQKDFYCVYNDYDVSHRIKELNLLYLPLVGSEAIKLYQFLSTKILSDKNLSKNYLHYDVLDNLAFDINKFVVARKKLEALGLLQTFYIKGDNVGQYIYKIKEALSFFDFFKNATLSQLLENTIGKTEYKEIEEYYSRDKVSFRSFEEISAKFSEVYHLENISSNNFNILEEVTMSGPNFDEYYFDFSKLNYFLANSYLTEILEKENTKNDILGLAHLYKVSPQDMAKAIEKSVKVTNGSNVLDVSALKDYLLQLYVNVRKQEVPTLDNMLNKKIVEESDKERLSDEERFIREVDNTNYVTYLNKQKNIVLSNVDAKAITDIQSKYNFPTGVLNILLEYAINVSNSVGIPHINYIDKIASSWKTKNLLGAKDAIDFVRQSRNQRIVQKTNNSQQKTKTYSSNQRKKVDAPFPDYLKERLENLSSKKEIENRVITSEDEDAYNQMLKELNRKRNT